MEIGRKGSAQPRSRDSRAAITESWLRRTLPRAESTSKHWDMSSTSMCRKRPTTTSTASVARRGQARSAMHSRSSRRMSRTICAPSRKRSASDCRKSHFQISTTTHGRRVASRFRSASGSPQSAAGKQRSDRGRKRRRIDRAAQRMATAAGNPGTRRSQIREALRRAPVARVVVVAGVRRRPSHLAVDRLHPLFGVTRTGCGSFRRGGVDAKQVVLRQHDIEGAKIFFDALGVPSAGYRHDVVTLRQHPRQCELGRCAIVLFGDFLDASDEIEVLLKILARKARVLPAEIILGEIFYAFDLAGQKSATERTVGDEANVERSEGLEQAIFGIAAPE